MVGFRFFLEIRCFLVFFCQWARSLYLSGYVVKTLREHYFVNTMFFGRMLRLLFFFCLFLLNEAELFSFVCLDVTFDCFSISASVSIHFSRYVVFRMVR